MVWGFDWGVVENGSLVWSGVCMSVFTVWGCRAEVCTGARWMIGCEVLMNEVAILLLGVIMIG